MKDTLIQFETLKETIKAFETREAKIYWIKALKVSDTIKGKLIVYFNLI